MVRVMVVVDDPNFLLGYLGLENCQVSLVDDATKRYRDLSLIEPGEWLFRTGGFVILTAAFLPLAPGTPGFHDDLCFLLFLDSLLTL